MMDITKMTDLTIIDGMGVRPFLNKAYIQIWQNPKGDPNKAHLEFCEKVSVLKLKFMRDVHELKDKYIKLA